MKTKTLNLFAFSILAIVLMVGFASADVTFTEVSGATQTVAQGNPVTVSFKLVGDSTLNATSIIYPTVILTVPGTTNSLSSSVVGAVSTLDANLTSTAMTLTFTISSSQALGTYTGTLLPTETGLTFDTLTIAITVVSDDPLEIQACNAIGNPGDLNIKDIEFNNHGMQDTEFGDDDEWFPLDDVEVDIEVENDGNDDVDDIEVEWGIWNTKTQEWVIDMDEEDEVNIGDGKDEIINLNFNLEGDGDVDLEDLTDGKDYRFYVIARGFVDGIVGGVTDPQTCVTDFETAEVIIENDFVVLNDIRVQEIAQCGADVLISAEVWNIGDDDQDEVSVEIHNNELGLFHKLTAIGDIDAFDDDAYSFNFRVPNDAVEKFYGLEFKVVDEDLDVYENDFDDDESRFVIPIQVSGGCSAALEDLTISASLQSGGKAGDELVMRATITNNEDELKTFTLNAAGYAQWADSVSLDQTSLVLNAGETRDVFFTFDVNKDASGSQSFTVELISDDNQVTTQPVSVAIEPRSGFGFTGNLISGDNLPWVIGALNIILVVIIIIVAVRVARR